MNRTFHARLLPGHCLLLLLVAFLAVWCLWEKRPVLAAADRFFYIGVFVKLGRHAAYDVSNF